MIQNKIGKNLAEENNTYKDNISTNIHMNYLKLYNDFGDRFIRSLYEFEKNIYVAYNNIPFSDIYIYVNKFICQSKYKNLVIKIFPGN
jgi:hypothetical protein